jgi:hypothetical protein
MTMTPMMERCNLCPPYACVDFIASVYINITSTVSTIGFTCLYTAFKSANFPRDHFATLLNLTSSIIPSVSRCASRATTTVSSGVFPNLFIRDSRFGADTIN